MPTSQTPGSTPYVPFKNGKRVTDLAGNIYLMIDSVLRLIPNVETYTRLFRTWAAIEQVDVGWYTIGPPIPPDAALRSEGTSVNLVMGGQIRLILDSVVMDLFQFSWPSVTPISPEDVKKLTRGPVIEIDFPDDGIAVGNSNAVETTTFMALDGKLRYMTPDQAQHIYRALNSLVSMYSLNSGAYLGDPMPANTSLRKDGDKRAVYLLVGTERRWIVSDAVFDQRQFDWGEIMPFDPGDTSTLGKNIGDSDTVSTAV